MNAEKIIAASRATRLEVLPFEAPADIACGLIRTRLEQNGKPIGANDLLIAAQAVALRLVLVTDNEREFARVDGLSCELAALGWTGKTG